MFNSFGKLSDGEMNKMNTAYLYEKRMKMGDKKYIEWLKKKIFYYQVMLLSSNQYKESEITKIVEVVNLIAEDYGKMTGTEVKRIEQKDVEKIIEKGKASRKIGKWDIVILIIFFIIFVTSEIQNNKIDQYNDAVSHYRQGNGYYDQGNMDAAESEYRKSIELDSSLGGSYVNLGNILKEKGNYAEAERIYKEGIENDPDYYLLYNNLGNLYLNKKEYEKAEIEFEKAIKLNESFDYPYYELFDLYIHLDKKEDLRILVKKYLDIKNTSKDELINNVLNDENFFYKDEFISELNNL